MIFEPEELSDLARQRNEIYKLIVGLIFRVHGVAFLVKYISFPGGFAELEILPEGFKYGLDGFVDWPIVFDGCAPAAQWKNYKLSRFRKWWRKRISHKPIGYAYDVAYVVEGKIIVSSMHRGRFKDGM